MNIVICDDCQEDRQLLNNLIHEYGMKSSEKFDITEYDKGTTLCSDAEELRKCQILFLDINMDEQDGLKTAVKIKELYPDIYIVLVTAYMSYSLEGYKVNASRFLLKDDLEHTIKECMESIIKEIKRKEQHIEFSFVEGQIKLNADDIIYIETNRHKNVFYTKKQTYTIYKKLDEIENELNGMGFVRVHLSFLVNMRYIDKISSYVLSLINGKEISVPKSRYQEVKRAFALYKGAE